MMMTTGDRIRRLRERKGWTQLQLAEIAKIHNSVLSRIEAGKRPVEDELVVRFALIFNTTTDYLLGLGERLQERSESYRTDPDIELMERLRREAFYLDGKELTDQEKERMTELLIDTAKAVKKFISRTSG
jgi:transcriptional regulator with XRE-family HTH domain